MKKKEHKARGEQRTLTREASCVDTFSKLEAIFLEKFFRFNISDYFYDSLLSLEEDTHLRKLRSKQLKQLASVTFVAQRAFSAQQFGERLDGFYRQGWDGDGPGFKHLYGNGLGGELGDVEEGELVVLQVRVRAEIEKMENLPLEVYREIQAYQQEPLLAQSRDEEMLLNRLRTYRHRTMSLFLVYYGDINFQVFDKFNYCPKAISFFGHDLLVKIHVFYISRLALVSKFRIINRIDSFDYINDLIFQLYEIRREKLRVKRARQREIKGGHLTAPEGNKSTKMVMSVFKWVTIISVTGISLGALFLKYFF